MVIRFSYTSFVLVILSLVILANPIPGNASELKPVNLKCEYRSNPLGVDIRQPRLSWELTQAEPGLRNQWQSAYQVWVASSPDALDQGKPDLWDSGRVDSSESIGIVYSGAPLPSRQRAYWRVRIWDQNGKESTSDDAYWEMALLGSGDWQAKWIRREEPAVKRDEDFYAEHPAPLLRRELEIAKPIQRARVYVTGLGYYELRINGHKVGDHVLDPGWTAYAKRVLYSTYDITSLLRSGTNAVGIMLGNGWYNPLPMRLWGRINLRQHLAIGQPRALVQLEVEYRDGTRETVASDQTWKTCEGPVRKNNVYLGEVYDARFEQSGWDQAGFDDTGWAPAILATEPLGPLRTQSAPPIKVRCEIPAKKITEPSPGVLIFDLGQNFAGWVRLRVKGPAGARVTMRYGELLYTNGTLNVMTSVCGQIKGKGIGGPGAPEIAWQSDSYILKGAGEEVYVPRFTFHGFRYVEVTGWPGATHPPLDAITGLALNSSVDQVGEFTCSNPRFNRIQEMARWTLLSNLFGVESDCPQREKFGYGGDMVAVHELALCNLDMSRFYAKAVEDFRDAVRANGGFTETAPFVGIADAGMGGDTGPVGWGTVHPLLQWRLYQYYGNRRILTEQYQATTNWMQFLESHATNGILVNGIGDHESLVPKCIPVSGTALYFWNARLCARIARAIGRTADAERFTRLADQIKDAFNRRFLDPATGQYDIGTQANQAFALRLGLAPRASQKATLDFLVNDILNTHDGHLTTGLFGTPFMLGALTRLDRVDVAYTVVDQSTFPGWGYMLENGATTVWEHWAFSDNTFSHNHPMFGSVSAWFYQALAGIQPAPDAMGFDHIIIKPNPVGDLHWVKASFDSVRGKIISNWEQSDNAFRLEAVLAYGQLATAGSLAAVC
ncbi:MAG: glycoside hydrolase family 78 protein [Candidatus Omnitrophica bacterium]|nr:glycoside hydrolase family 78 protein [Candidatus Omnitrophota bacterium]